MAASAIAKRWDLNNVCASFEFTDPPRYVVVYEESGAAVEPAYETAAESPMVSGSPASVVPFDTLSR